MGPLMLEIAENLERSDNIWLTGYSNQMSDNVRSNCEVLTTLNSITNFK